MTTKTELFIAHTLLEESGRTPSEIDDYFLAHYGVRGMRWGSKKLSTKEIRKRENDYYTKQGYTPTQTLVKKDQYYMNSPERKKLLRQIKLYDYTSTALFIAPLIKPIRKKRLLSAGLLTSSLALAYVGAKHNIASADRIMYNQRIREQKRKNR